MVNPFIMAEETLANTKRNLQKQRKVAEDKELEKLASNLNLLSIQQHVVQVFKDVMPTMFSEPVETTNYEINYGKFVDLYREKCNVTDQFRKGILYLQEIIQSGNVEGYWSLDIPSLSIEVSRELIPYDEHWLKKSKQCLQLHEKWIADIESKRRVKYTPEILFTDILLSSIFHSGIHDINRLLALAQFILKKQKITSTDSYYWVQLSLSQNHVNHIDEDNNLTYQYNQFLALPTIGLIGRYYRNNKMNCSFLNDEELKKFFVKNIKPYNLNHLTFNEVCRYSQMTIHLNNGIQYPQILSHVALGDICSTALYHENWELIYRPVEATNAEIKIKRSYSAISGKNKTRAVVNRSDFILKIRHHLRDRISSNQKNSRLDAKKQLDLLKEKNEFSDSENVILSWLCYQLEKNNELSTLNTYLSRACILWLLFCNNENIDEWSGEKFLSVYRDILEQDYNANKKITNDSIKHHDHSDYSSVLAELLTRIHTHAMKEFGLEALPEHLLDGTKKITHVKAGFISEPHFKFVLNALSNCTELSSQEKNVLICIATIAFRTGLRFSEIQYLKLNNIENSDELWIYVRCTSADNLKTLSARRRIPLGLLLTPDEKIIIKNYLNEKFGQEAYDSTKFAFTLGKNQYLPIPGDMIRQTIKSAINQCSDKSKSAFTFHHLRHTALSRLQLIIHRKILNYQNEQNIFWRNSVAWSPEQCDQIYHAILSGHPRGDYWALCKFSGHQSPATTLKNYLHFSDLVAASCMNAGVYQWSSYLINYFSGISLEKINELSKNSTYFCESAYSNAMKEAIGKFTKLVLYTDRAMPNISPIIHKLNIHAIYEIISVLELHHDHSFLQTKYDLNDDVIIDFFSAAVKLSSFKTEKGKSRINSTSRSNLLQPAKLRSHAEQNEFSRLVPKFEVFSEVEIDEFEFLSRYYFLHKNTSNHAIAFNSLELLERFVKILLNFFDAKRIYVELSKANSLWLKHLPKSISIKMTNSSSGSAKLCVLHPENEKVIENYQSNMPSLGAVKDINKYSTPILKNLLFGCVLLRLDSEKIDSWGI